MRQRKKREKEGERERKEEKKEESDAEQERVRRRVRSHAIKTGLDNMTDQEIKFHDSNHYDCTYIKFYQYMICTK